MSMKKILADLFRGWKSWLLPPIIAGGITGLFLTILSFLR
jgi:hypothetical protein